MFPNDNIQTKNEPVEFEYNDFVAKALLLPDVDIKCGDVDDMILPRLQKESFAQKVSV